MDWVLGITYWDEEGSYEGENFNFAFKSREDCEKALKEILNFIRTEILDKYGAEDIGSL